MNRPDDAAARVREALLRAGYTVDGVVSRLGASAVAALERLETVPAHRATAGGDALDSLIRLFLLQLPVGGAAAAAALPAQAARELGLVVQSGTAVRAALDVRPHQEAAATGQGPAGPPWWLVSDLDTGLDGMRRPLSPEHVLGLGGASTTLAQTTVRHAVDRTLDVGTGSGVQALHASRHSRVVVATDVSPRAVHLAGITSALSGVRLDLRAGDLFAPVRDETFDLVVSNPPFVVGAPPGATRYTYRDSGLPLDAIGARLAREAPALLTRGGTFQMLASWVHRDGEPWQERVGGWLPVTGVDALVLQREVLDPAAYVATWLRDAGELGSPGYRETYDGWLSALEAAGVTAIGLGSVAVRRTDAVRRLTALDWPHPVEQPLGPVVDGWFERQRWLACHERDEDLLGAAVRVAADVVQEQVGPPGAEDPERLLLRRGAGLRQAFAADTATAALVGACDGTLPLGTLVAAVGRLVGEPAAAGVGASGRAPGGLVEQVRVLVAAGVLEPSV